MTAVGPTGSGPPNPMGAGSPAGFAGSAQTRDVARSGRLLAAALDQARQARPAQADPVAASQRTARVEGPLAEAARAPAPVSGAGDAILDGLQKLRGVFDAQQDRVNKALSSPAVDFETLFSVQREAANFSLLVDVASKLTGKSTQAFETLLKGQ